MGGYDGNNSTFPRRDGYNQDDRGGGNNGGNGGGWNRNGNNGGGGGWQNKKNFGGKGGFNKKPEEALFYRPYAVTGNDGYPEYVLGKLVNIIKTLEARGYTLRTGGLRGFEEAAEKAVEDPKMLELILPFKGFADKSSQFTWANESSELVARRFHTSYDTAPKGVQSFLKKNARIILGNSMRSPSLFLLTWTEDGSESVVDVNVRTGNSGHAIKIACGIPIPVFNLSKDDAEQRLMAYLETEDTKNAASNQRASISQPQKESSDFGGSDDDDVTW